MIDDLAARATARLLDAVAAQAAADVPEVAVTRTADALVLAAPGLALRSLTDARLRGLAPSALADGGRR